MRVEGLVDAAPLRTYSVVGAFRPSGVLGDTKADTVPPDVYATSETFQGVKSLLRGRRTGLVAPTDRPELIETELAALSGCLDAAVSASAIATGIDFDEIETAVSIAWGPFVFLRLEEIERDGEPVDVFGDLAVEIEVAGEDLDDADLASLRESVGRRAVYDQVTQAHACEPRVRLTDGQ